jgi:hypothetical protein
MNKQLQDFARAELKKGLLQLTDGNRRKFNRIYAGQSKIDQDTNKTVEDMPEETLDWAMEIVRRGLAKKKQEAPDA